MIALLIDGLNLVRRVFAGVPGEDATPEHDEDVLLAITRSVERALDQSEPSHALCVFDAPGKSWRHTLMPDYKANRPPMPAPLAALMLRIEEALAQLGVRCVRVPGFEADDVIASVAAKIAARGGQALILSTDKSMMSLLRAGIRVRNHFDQRDLDAAYCRERFGVDPEQIPTYLALVGESSQNVPGVKTVGPKTATRLIAEHRDLEAILTAAPDLPGRTGAALVACAADARLSLQLTTLRTDVPVGLNLNECRFTNSPG